MEKDPVYILYVPDMAKKLRKSVSGIRAAVYRNSRSIPRPFKLGGRVAWVEADVDKWLEKNKRTKILYVPDMAKKLRKSSSGILAAVHRNSSSIPRPFKIDGKLGWEEADVDAWLEQQKQERKM